tara:strand:+ start:3547 stop:4953 length:1407 start_codon:yes stop_codon:yes gene_type:complete
MAWWNPFSRRLVGASEKPEEVVPLNRTASRSERTPFTVMAAGIDNIVKETNDFRDNYDYTNEFDLYDNMLNYDPELNGAVRTISLTANKYKVVGGKNGTIRKAVTNLTEEVLDFDDLLINAMRNLMVYGNDISKYVGKTGTGLTEVQSLPLSQMSILDNRPPNTTTDKDNAILTNERYLLREQDRDMQEFPRDEILHIRIDYRSYWYKDRLGRWTYGVWGASRFSSLKQAIRAKYNSMNNRIALEDSLTKQYITIGPEATANITDPDEANARLGYVMDEVGTLLDGLRSDQVPILPHYVNMQFVDLKNTIPDNSSFLDSVNGDISSVLHVPRVSMGQERGSTFAATFNASQWSVQSIRRLQKVLSQSMQQLFSKHLTLLGIQHNNADLPKVIFEPMDEESPFEQTRRATMAFEAGITTLNEAREEIGYAPQKGKEGKQRSTKPSNPSTGELPRENENKPPEETESEEI